MSSHITPYLLFNNQCREAMNFYKDCFGGELILQTVAETPMASHMAPEMQNQIIHSQLKSDAIAIMASDNCMNMAIQTGNQVSLCINCGSEEDINTFFTKLSAGGKVSMPLKTEFWGDTFGQLTDKFGINWMLNFSQKKE